MKSVIVLFCILILLTACSGIRGTQQESTSEQKMEAEKEATSKMRREFCVVKHIDDREMVLINTKNEAYRIDASFANEYKEDDKVLFLYTERTAVGENEYTAEVYAVYPDDDKILEPERF